VRILLELNINPQQLYNEIIKVVSEYDNQDGTANKVGKSSYNSTPTLNQFGMI
jgi:hypothetical protein